MWQTLFLLLNPLCLAGIIFYMLGRFSGWFGVADKYSQKKQYLGDWESYQSVAFQGISFNRCIYIGIDSEALFLRPSFPLNYIFAPLEIPWSSIKSAKRVEKFWRKIIRLRLNDPDVTIDLKEDTLQRARPFLPLDAV